jgi:phage terminase small subunit
LEIAELAGVGKSRVTALNPKQQRFVAEYLLDLNATKAAIRAGYSAKNADVTGPRMLGNVGIAAEIEKRQAELAGMLGVTVDRIVGELAKLGFSNMLDYMRVGPSGDPVLDFSALTRDQAAALTEVTVEDFMDGRGEDARDVRRVKFKLADKRGPLVDLGKHLGMFVDRVNVTVTPPVLPDLSGWGDKDLAELRRLLAKMQPPPEGAVKGGSRK